jgi:predicted AAA+ superfamily ATPase
MMYGARQVGKTYALKEFGKREYDNMIYINCYMNSDVATLFGADVNVSRILLGLSAISGETITPGKTLIFLDEVQEIPEVVAALKYFCEDAPDVHIAVAGSLLGVLNMQGISFPTGKVDIMHMHPMTFNEFLLAVGEKKKCELLGNPEAQEVVNALLPSYTDLLRQYYFVGGMPEAVAEFVRTKSPEAVRQVQTNIIAAYEADIAKHAGSDTLRARMVFQSIPSQLAKENKKFIYGALKKGARAGDFENAIQWLVDAGLVLRVPRVSKVAMPLRFYSETDAFKLYLLDVGLLGAMAQAPAAMMLVGDNVFSEFKGAFSENYVLTQLITNKDVYVAYYAKNNSTMELDFVVQSGANIYPVEVKAEQNVKSKSLRNFVTIDNAGSGMRGYRLSMRGFIHQDWLTNVPLCAAANVF